jgi:drug/metabolite transporter (DMT)-like permease
VIYGLVAALGWGLADFGGAVVGRRIGSLWTVLVAQAFAAAGATVIVLTGDHDITRVTGVLLALFLNAAFSAMAYVTHYRALELGPVAVVSPVGATYAVVGVTLAIVVLGERPSAIALAGGGVTILGVMLTSTDLRAVRAKTHGMPPGLPWAIASAFGFGVGGFILAYLSRELGWVLGLWGSRCAQMAAFVALGLLRRKELRGRLSVGPYLFGALVIGAADLLGVLAYAIGAERGFVSIVFVASAVFPILAVGLSVAFLSERPVPNQYVGVILVVAGLVLLGFN